MPPPRTVTCYICGRDFGSRSIGIHLPSCTKKWEQEQEKLPKKERRPLPTAPVDFDKVVKGEVKGKALAKINQQAADEFNEAALEPCAFCGRTFLPTALAHHKSACTEEKPMAKKAPGESYTAQAKAKVNYPKLKPKTSKAAAEPAAEKVQEKIQERVEEKPAAVALEIQINQEKKQETAPVKPSTPKVTKKPPTGPPAKPPLPDDQDEDDRPTSGASSMVMVSRPGSNRSSLDLEPEEEKETRSEEEAREQAEREEFEALERAAALEEEPSPIQTRPRKSTTTLSRGPGTFRKSATYVSKDIVKTRTNGVSREDLISYLEQEGLMEEEEHRREVLVLLTDYTKKVRKQQMELVLASPVLDNPEVMEEAVSLMQDFVRRKNV